jgi:hypothetical protein
MNTGLLQKILVVTYSMLCNHLHGMSQAFLEDKGGGTPFDEPGK